MVPRLLLPPLARASRSPSSLQAAAAARGGDCWDGEPSRSGEGTGPWPPLTVSDLVVVVVVVVVVAAGRSTAAAIVRFVARNSSSSSV